MSVPTNGADDSTTGDEPEVWYETPGDAAYPDPIQQRAAIRRRLGLPEDTVIDDTPVPIENAALLDWRPDALKFEVPGWNQQCPDCRATLTPYGVALPRVLPLRMENLVWLMKCPMEGTFFEYRDLS